MKEQIPVNPEVLRWARESLGASVEYVAGRINKKPEAITAWERGESAPTYVQLEKLAYAVYKRPLALFFFPAPPAEDRPEQSFRTLPDYKIAEMPPHLRYLLRKARVLQLNLEELCEGQHPAPRKIVRELTFQPEARASMMAGHVRRFLRVPLRTQQSWDATDVALETWRESLESVGVSIFKDSFREPRGQRKAPQDEVGGFCLYDTEFPLIYVNNNVSKTRQVFTLFHELAHLLLGTGGVETARDDYIQRLRGGSRRVEVLCNRFAGEFLVPRADLERQAEGLSEDETSIRKLARLYCVSGAVVLRRLLDIGRIDREAHDRLSGTLASERSGSRGSGGDPYRTKGAYLGAAYIEKVFSKYYNNSISIDQTAQYLWEKPKNVPGFERWLLERGTVT